MLADQVLERIFGLTNLLLILPLTYFLARVSWFGYVGGVLDFLFLWERFLEIFVSWWALLALTAGFVWVRFNLVTPRP